MVFKFESGLLIDSGLGYNDNRLRVSKLVKLASVGSFPHYWLILVKQRYQFLGYILFIKRAVDTYDHRLRNTGHPVRSAIHKPQIGRLVVGWVTTSEYLLLYVFAFLTP